MTTAREAKRRAEMALTRALDESPRVTHAATRTALHAYVDVLAAEGLMPEAVVIAFKDLLLRARTLHRFESEARVEMRAALVSECIAHYFGVETPADIQPMRPKLKIIRGGELNRAGATDERAPDGRP
jgi:hypothetical protein